MKMAKWLTKLAMRCNQAQIHCRTICCILYTHSFWRWKATFAKSSFVCKELSEARLFIHQNIYLYITGYTMLEWMNEWKYLSSKMKSKILSWACDTELMCKMLSHYEEYDVDDRVNSVASSVENFLHFMGVVRRLYHYLWLSLAF